MTRPAIPALVALAEARGWRKSRWHLAREAIRSWSIWRLARKAVRS